MLVQRRLQPPLTNKNTNNIWTTNQWVMTAVFHHQVCDGSSTHQRPCMPPSLSPRRCLDLTEHRYVTLQLDEATHFKMGGNHLMGGPETITTTMVLQLVLVLVVLVLVLVLVWTTHRHLHER